MRLSFTVLVALTLALAVACGGGGSSDPTKRAITDDELSLMVLPQSELGSQYADFTLDDTSGIQSNDKTISDAFDSEDETQDVQRFGRDKGYDQSYTSLDALLAEEKGTFGIGTSLDVYGDAGGASGDLQDKVADWQKAVGQSKENVTVEEGETFEVKDVGDEAVGMIIPLTVEGDQGMTLTQTLVGFREGRLLGAAYVQSSSDEDVRDEATALAQKLDERILAVLRGEVKAPEAPEATTAPSAANKPKPTSTAKPKATRTAEATPEESAAVSPSDVLDSFRFTAEMGVEVGTGLVLTTEGQFEAPDRLDCTVSGSLAGAAVGSDQLVVIGSDAWLDSGDGFQATTADDPDVVQDLSLCPGSPAFWTDFDFLQNTGALKGEPDTVNGVDATKYSLADVAGALQSVGFLPPELEGVTIDTFDVWVAQDGGWPLALDMDITAEAQAAADTFGLPVQAGGPDAHITMHVDITDANASDIHVGQPVY